MAVAEPDALAVRGTVARVLPNCVVKITEPAGTLLPAVEDTTAVRVVGAFVGAWFAAYSVVMVGTAATVKLPAVAVAKVPAPAMDHAPASVGVHTALPEPAALIETVAVDRT